MARPPYPCPFGGEDPADRSRDPLFVKWALETRVRAARENGFWTGVAVTLSVMACVGVGVLWFRP